MWVLHIMAVIFFLPALFVTIPLHIIIGMMGGRGNAEPVEKSGFERGCTFLTYTSLLAIPVILVVGNWLGY